MFRNVFYGCVSERNLRAEEMRSHKIKFGAALPSALKYGLLPQPLVDILVFIANEGVATADVFRRPGNPNDTRRIVKRLNEGKQVIYSNYSFYTLASVVKKFLLRIPGGVFTPEGEEQLLHVLTLTSRNEQIEAVHRFMESLSQAHQQLVALLFGTWYRIVLYSERNCMSVEALSRSVAGSMFHTCAEDPAKVEKASRIMQFLIDNYNVDEMFGRENIRFCAETTRTGIQIRELMRSYCPDSQIIPSLNIDVTRMSGETSDDEEEDKGLGQERELSQSPEMFLGGGVSDMSHDPLDQSEMINMTTLSAPEVSLMSSPDVSMRPKSVEDNLNEVRSHYQNRALSRFNSVKRKQLERLRQRSDWFLSPESRERNNSRKSKGEGSLSLFIGNNGNKKSGNNGNANNSMTSSMTPGSTGLALQQKNSGTSVVTKASSEGAVLEAFSDGDSVFTDTTSRSESPASEPVWSHILKVHSRDVIHSDTVAELSLPANYGSGADLSIDSHDIALGTDAFFSPIPLAAEDGGPSLTDMMSDTVLDTDGAAADHEDNFDDDEDNTTPTGLQDEEDTLLTCSQPSGATSGCDTDSSPRSETTDKDLRLALPLSQANTPCDDTVHHDFELEAAEEVSRLSSAEGEVDLHLHHQPPDVRGEPQPECSSAESVEECATTGSVECASTESVGDSSPGQQLAEEEVGGEGGSGLSASVESCSRGDESSSNS